MEVAWLDVTCIKIHSTNEVILPENTHLATPDTPFASLDAFYEFVGRYREAGINEFIIGY